MIQILTGTILLSLLHAIIPNHWLPVLAVAKKQNWKLRETLQITFLAGMAHVISTLFIGFLISILGYTLKEQTTHFLHIIAPLILIAMGIFFIYQHHHHHHFDLKAAKGNEPLSKRKIVALLIGAMFLSPCLEIEGFFLMAGGIGVSAVIQISTIYTLLTVGGMLIWVTWAYKGLSIKNWHSIEHNAGIITGLVLVATGVLSFFLH